MRAIAIHLGVQPASLYNHIRSRSDLLAEMAEALCAEMAPIPPNAAWRKQLLHMGQEQRRVMLQHRDGAALMAATPPVGRQRLTLIEQVLNTLSRSGLSKKDVPRAAFVFNSYVVGFTLDEIHQFEGDADSSATQELFAGITRESHPTLFTLSRTLAAPPMSDYFSFGLEVVLDGLDRRRRDIKRVSKRDS